MKRLELTVPFWVLEDLGILSPRFFRNNESIAVLQSFSSRPGVAALIVRVTRAGPFKDAATIRREARAVARRYQVPRFEILSSDRERGEYVAWIEWKLPPILRGELGGEWGGVVPLEVARSGPEEARVVVLTSEAVLPRLRTFLEDARVPYRVRAVRTSTGPWQPLASLTPRQRELLELAYRSGYYRSPAAITLDRIGGLVGISKAAVSKHLRSAERKLLAAVLASKA